MMSTYLWLFFHLIIHLGDGVLPVEMVKAPIRRSSTLNVDKYKAGISGDIILGGFFSIRRGDDCSQWTDIMNIRRVEAMLYAINQVNANSSILPGLTLGAEIRDDCYSSTIALEESLGFILNAFGQNQDLCHTSSNNNSSPVMGVVGTGSSGTAVTVASFLRLFHLPQVSYAATSPDLSDRKEYEYFTRVVPSDVYQAEALVDVISYFNWTAVYLISSSGNYGKRIMEAFLRSAHKRNLCIVDKAELGADFASMNATIARFILKINATRNVRAVVLLTETFHNKFILEEVKSIGIAPGRFIWLASDTWGTGQTLDGVEDIANGAITIALHTHEACATSLIDQFSHYFNALRPTNISNNPWFQYLWQDIFQCFLPWNKETTNYTKQCKGDEKLDCNWTDDKLPYVLDSVTVLVDSLQRMLDEQCSVTETKRQCLRRLAHDKVELYDYLLRVNITGASGWVAFDANGNGVPRYDIMRYDSGTYERIAVWSTEQKFILDLQPAHKEQLEAGSYCAQACYIGEERIGIQGVPSCCWSCRKCSSTDYVNQENTCQSCAEGSQPNHNKTGCERLPLGYPANYVAVILTIWATLGLMVTIFVAYTMYRFYSTPIMMASGRELMLVLLAGIALCHSLGYASLGEPTKNRCIFQRFGSGIFMCVCYSAILVKTNRIARIFRGRHRPAFITPAPQLLITALLISVQIGITLAASIFGADSESTIFYDKGHVYHVCRTSGMEYLISISYNVLLLLLCTCYAFLTRKLPANFNEAKIIGITMYANCVLWICFLPLFYGSSPIYQTSVLLLNSCFNATVLLSGAFGPKVYIVWLRPEKNTRQASNPRGRTGSSQSGYSIHSLPMEELNGVSGSKSMRRFSSRATLESFTGSFPALDNMGYR